MCTSLGCGSSLAGGVGPLATLGGPLADGLANTLGTLTGATPVGISPLTSDVSSASCAGPVCAGNAISGFSQLALLQQLAINIFRLRADVVTLSHLSSILTRAQLGFLNAILTPGLPSNPLNCRASPGALLAASITRTQASQLRTTLSRNRLIPALLKLLIVLNVVSCFAQTSGPGATLALFFQILNNNGVGNLALIDFGGSGALYGRLFTKVGIISPLNQTGVSAGNNQTINPETGTLPSRYTLDNTNLTFL